LAPVLPWLEIGLGALLVAGLGRPWDAAAAIALLVAFSAAIGVHLRRGDAVPCGCFGAASTRPVGGRDLVRNAVLVGLAVVALR
jgi:uncharacterized membrane protein YphA (DoxX/SURF4 family)